MIDFSLSTDTGESLTLSSLRGRTVILYFYPKDDTSGCTQESCEFRDRFPRFAASDAVVLGISPDDVTSHRKFKAKYNLPFTLLVDENHALAERLGIWVEKLFYGKKYMGVQRTTYIIGTEGEVKHVFEKVNPAGHADEVMAFLAGGVEAAQRARAEYDAIAAKAAVKPVKKPAKKVVKKAAKKPTRKLVRKVAKKPAKKSARKVIKKSIKKVATRKKTSSKTARHGK